LKPWSVIEVRAGSRGALFVRACFGAFPFFFFAAAMIRAEL